MGNNTQNKKIHAKGRELLGRQKVPIVPAPDRMHSSSRLKIFSTLKDIMSAYKCLNYQLRHYYKTDALDVLATCIYPFKEEEMELEKLKLYAKLRESKRESDKRHK